MNKKELTDFYLDKVKELYDDLGRDLAFHDRNCSCDDCKRPEQKKLIDIHTRLFYILIADINPYEKS